MGNYRKSVVRSPRHGVRTAAHERVIRHTNTLHGRLGCLVKGAKASANAKNLEFLISRDDVVELWHEQAGKCRYTGWDMATENHSPKLVSLERKDNNHGYYKDNCVLVAWAANRAKSVMSLEEFVAMCAAVTETSNQTQAKRNHNPTLERAG